jgi:hypothetical protein
METVASSDGTTIAFDRLGDGPPVIVVGGQLCDRTLTRSTAEVLAKRFTVFNYDRRGRGDSGDTAPYALEREVEDIGALIAEAGRTASVYAHSSGAALVPQDDPQHQDLVELIALLLREFIQRLGGHIRISLQHRVPVALQVLQLLRAVPQSFELSAHRDASLLQSCELLPEFLAGEQTPGGEVLVAAPHPFRLLQLVVPQSGSSNYPIPLALLSATIAPRGHRAAGESRVLGSV